MVQNKTCNSFSLVVFLKSNFEKRSYKMGRFIELSKIPPVPVINLKLVFLEKIVFSKLGVVCNEYIKR